MAIKIPGRDLADSSLERRERAGLYDHLEVRVLTWRVTRMSRALKRAALYVRVSTDHQSVENQVRELRLVAERRGWQVAEVYRDAGISGAKGRDQRPGLDSLLKDASRRKF